MKVNLAYGQGQLPVELPEGRTTVIAPSHTPGLPDERGAVIRALEKPIGAKPLREIIQPGEEFALSSPTSRAPRRTSGSFRGCWSILAHVPRENITLLNQLGTHRPNTSAELEQMLTPEVVRIIACSNHEPENPRRARATRHDARRHARL